MGTRKCPFLAFKLPDGTVPCQHTDSGCPHHLLQDGGTCEELTELSYSEVTRLCMTIFNRMEQQRWILERMS
jgi:hypothetical protein